MIFYGAVIDYLKDSAQGELFVSIFVMIIIAILGILMGNAIKKADPKKPSKGLAFFAEALVEYAQKQISDILGTAYLKFTPYYIFLLLYIPLAFVMGLLGLPSPMTYFTIPLCLALVTWLGINISAIHFQKVEYLKGFTSPLPTWMPIFVPINMLSKMAPLLSLSIRLFGNALAGYILMWLVYWGTGLLSSAIIPLEGLNIFGMIIAPVLHAYFDVFGAFIQMIIFTTLTMLLISIEIPAPVNVDPSKKSKKASKKEA